MYGLSTNRGIFIFPSPLMCSGDVGYESPKEKREYSEIHLARIYLLMASCCAMPAPTFAIQPAAASCQEHLPYCHINLDGPIDGGETYECSIMVCNGEIIRRDDLPDEAFPL